MKNFVVKIFVSALFLGVIGLMNLNAQSDDNEKFEVKIKTSAYSEMCKNRIETELKEREGVIDAYLDLHEQVVTITYNSNKVKSDSLKELVSNMGYDSEIITDRALNKTNENSSQVKLNK